MNAVALYPHVVKGSLTCDGQKPELPATSAFNISFFEFPTDVEDKFVFQAVLTRSWLEPETALAAGDALPTIGAALSSLLRRTSAQLYHFKRTLLGPSSRQFGKGFAADK